MKNDQVGDWTNWIHNKLCPRTTIKDQAITDFITESLGFTTPEAPPLMSE